MRALKFFVLLLTVAAVACSAVLAAELILAAL